jgi:3-isopropylmalate dehydratase small subunit
VKLLGRVWKLGDGVGATDLLPAAYDKAASTGKWDECASHVLETLRPDFQGSRNAGDLIVAGTTLGAGHAHYHRGAVLGCKAAGLAALIGESVNGLFFRSAIDEGYPCWPLPGISNFVENGNTLEIDFAAGLARNVTKGTTMNFPPVNQVVLDILEAGSTMGWALMRYSTKLAA